MVHGKKRILCWIDRRLTGLTGPEYHAIISFRLSIEPEDSQYGESWLYISPTAHVVDTVTEQSQRSLYAPMAQPQCVQHGEQSHERMSATASSHTFRSGRHRLPTMLAPISLSGHMGDIHVHDLAEFGSTPLVPSICLTSWALSGGCGVGLDGLLGEAYDVLRGITRLNWSYTSPILKVTLPSLNPLSVPTFPETVSVRSPFTIFGL